MPSDINMIYTPSSEIFACYFKENLRLPNNQIEYLMKQRVIGAVAHYFGDRELCKDQVEIKLKRLFEHRNRRHWHFEDLTIYALVLLFNKAIIDCVEMR